MNKPIPLDATEVAYHASFRSPPEIVKVTKHTATQVEIEGRSRRFTRATGKVIGGSNFNGAYIETVEQRHHDHIAAIALHKAADEVWQTVWKAQEARFSKQRDGLRKVGEGRDGNTPTAVRAAIARLSHFAKEQFGIEVDVAVEKKA